MEPPNIKGAKCCGLCKHSTYSTRVLDSWCTKYPQYKEYSDTEVCDDYEG